MEGKGLSKFGICLPERGCVTPSERYLLVKEGGVGPRTWFGGERSHEKELWMSDMRGYHLDSLVKRLNGGEPKLMSRLILQDEPRGGEWDFGEDLAVRAVDLWGKWEALNMMVLACGGNYRDITELISTNDISRTLEEARAVSDEDAERVAREILDAKGWESSTAKPLKASPKGVGWEEVKTKAHELIEIHGLRHVSIPGDTSESQAWEILESLKYGLGLMGRVTGLGDAAGGLGGWGIEFGRDLDGYSGLCDGIAKRIMLGSKKGDGALAHEWFHALDFEMGKIEGLKFQGLSWAYNDEFRGALGEGLRKVVVELSKEGNGAIADETVEKIFERIWMKTGAWYSAQKEGGRESFEARWRVAAEEMFFSFKESEGKSNQEGFKKMFKEKVPEISEDNLLEMWKGFQNMRNPDQKYRKILDKARTRSDFLTSAMLFDWSYGSLFFAEPNEMLARAFETAVALDRAREELGLAAGTPVSMVSSSPDEGEYGVEGMERDRAREAFDRFFKRLRETLKRMGERAPSWSCGIEK